MIEIADDFADLIGRPTAERLVSRVHSTGDCQTCGASLGEDLVNLYAQCLMRSPDGFGPWVVTAHHPGCQAAAVSKSGAVEIDSSIGITYRAVALSIETAQARRGGWIARMMGRGAGIGPVLPILWVCPSIDFFMIDVVSPGNAIDTDLQQYLGEPAFHNMIESVPDLAETEGPKGALAVIDEGVLITTPPMGWSVRIEPNGPYERAVRDCGGVLALVSTYGGIHTPGLLNGALEPLVSAGEVAGAWVPLGRP
jgi:hypothetical protein